MNNSKFGDYVDRIYTIELEIKDTTDIEKSILYLYLHHIIDSKGWLRAKLYDKREDFDFHILNVPFMSINFLAAHATGLYISQPIRYSRACDFYQDFYCQSVDIDMKATEARDSQGNTKGVI